MLTERETDLLEALAHSMKMLAETKHTQYHRDWLSYHLGRALQGCPQKVADNMVALLEKVPDAGLGSEPTA